MQEAAIEHVPASDASLPVPRLVRTRDGERHARWRSTAGVEHVVRALTYLPGTKLDARDISLDALHRYGALAARMGVALRGFEHPAAHHALLWDNKQAAGVRPLLRYVEDPARRPVVDRWLTRIEAETLPAMAMLRAQVIHNDLTRDNVLFDQNQSVSAVLDFGDMVHTALVCDLANLLAALLGERPDFLAVAEAAIRGYDSVTRLEDAELLLLADVVATRAVADIVVSEWRKERHPENAEYITHWKAGSWVILDTLEEMGMEEATGRFRDFVR